LREYLTKKGGKGERKKWCRGQEWRSHGRQIRCDGGKKERKRPRARLQKIKAPGGGREQTQSPVGVGKKKNKAQLPLKKHGGLGSKMTRAEPPIINWGWKSSITMGSYWQRGRGGKKKRKKRNLTKGTGRKPGYYSGPKKERRKGSSFKQGPG